MIGAGTGLALAGSYGHAAMKDPVMRAVGGVMSDGVKDFRSNAIKSMTPPSHLRPKDIGKLRYGNK